MIAALLLAVAVVPGASPALPATLVVATPKGDVRIAIRPDVSGPLVSATALVPALGGLASVVGAWVHVEIASQPFRLLLNAPYYTAGGVLKPLVGVAVIRRDSLFLPLDFVTQVLPAELTERFRYDPWSGRLDEARSRRPGPAIASSEPKPPRAADAVRTTLPNGLNRGHVVTIDPGHGGVDPGNLGVFFPRGIKEKDVALQVGLLVRQELLRRGVGVIMTRTTDTLIDLHQRAAFCTERCGLFVSLHVNALPKRAGYTKARGFETFFLADAKTEDAARVAKMENEAIRFEEPKGEQPSGLDFILKDLQLNEYHRESARLAELMQSHAAEVHAGTNRGVKQAGLAVLTTARRPAVLFEMGFSTNPEDARLMTEARSQRNLAASVADAIVSYLIEYQQRVGSNRSVTQTGAGQA